MKGLSSGISFLKPFVDFLGPGRGFRRSVVCTQLAGDESKEKA